MDGHGGERALRWTKRGKFCTMVSDMYRLHIRVDAVYLLGVTALYGLCARYYSLSPVSSTCDLLWENTMSEWSVHTKKWQHIHITLIVKSHERISNISFRLAVIIIFGRWEMKYKPSIGFRNHYLSWIRLCALGCDCKTTWKSSCKEHFSWNTQIWVWIGIVLILQGCQLTIFPRYGLRYIF